jgi:hypothetical protein
VQIPTRGEQPKPLTIDKALARPEPDQNIDYRRLCTFRNEEIVNGYPGVPGTFPIKGGVVLAMDSEPEDLPLFAMEILMCGTPPSMRSMTIVPVSSVSNSRA